MAVADEHVFYYQITMGPAHIARVRALNQQPGIRCRGVALAAQEKTRRFELSPPAGVDLDEVTGGTYEKTSSALLLAAAKRHILSMEPTVLVIDSPADVVQYRLGRWAQRRGILVFTRWAATWLDHPRHALKEFLKRFVYGRWDAYLLTGLRASEYLALFGVPRNRFFTCGNPVDAEAIEGALANLGIVERGGDLLFAGRFLRLKNLVSFVRAFGRYREEGGRLGLRLAGFGETEEDVRQIANAIPGVALIGHLQIGELVREYATCAALVLPSYSENWGLVVNEAMHAGAPVLASTHVGCVPELIEDGVTGLLFEPLSEDSMVDALRRFEALSAAERSAMSLTASKKIRDQTPERWAARVAGAIRAVRESQADRTKLRRLRRHVRSKG